MDIGQIHNVRKWLPPQYANLWAAKQKKKKEKRNLQFNFTLRRTTHNSSLKCVIVCVCVSEKQNLGLLDCILSPCVFISLPNNHAASICDIIRCAVIKRKWRLHFRLDSVQTHLGRNKRHQRTFGETSKANRLSFSSSKLSYNQPRPAAMTAVT